MQLHYDNYKNKIYFLIHMIKLYRAWYMCRDPPTLNITRDWMLILIIQLKENINLHYKLQILYVFVDITFTFMQKSQMITTGFPGPVIYQTHGSNTGHTHIGKKYSKLLNWRWTCFWKMIFLFTLLSNNSNYNINDKVITIQNNTAE